MTLQEKWMENWSIKTLTSQLPNPIAWQWDRTPSFSDPRLSVLGVLALYIVLGITILGFNRSPGQILLIISSACLLDMLFHWLFRGRQLLFPLSAAITGCSLSILTNFAHGLWLPLVPVFFAISSKYLITVKGRHVFNPALFGITLSLLVGHGMISASPAYQWGGSVAMVMFIVTAALVLFAFRIQRTALIVSFLILYTLQLGARAYLMRHLVAPETLIMGALTAPAFYLFTFFMITDPATSPRTVKGQIGMSLSIVFLDLYLHKFESLSTLFYAGFIYFAGRFVWLQGQSLFQQLAIHSLVEQASRLLRVKGRGGQDAHPTSQEHSLAFDPPQPPDNKKHKQHLVSPFLRGTEGGSKRGENMRQEQQQEHSLAFDPPQPPLKRGEKRKRGEEERQSGTSFLSPVLSSLFRWGVIGLMGAAGFLGYQQFVAAKDVVQPDFQFVEMAAADAGISTHKSDILEQVDPRVQHVAKWLLSVGDAIAVADVNQDGLQDVFLTYPLKDKGDRAALYLNQGNFQFQRFELPVLDEFIANPETQGLPGSALWWDYDNDSDADLLLTVGYGKSRLLQNRLVESGQLEFADISQEVGIDEYTISLTANAFDMNQDGKLDLMIGNAMNPLLPGYDKPTHFNIFNLPEAEYPGDRRMLNVMHRSWHDADNGGENLFYLNQGEKFQKQEIKAFGLEGNRWTLDIGTGDLNGDGWTDLYLANDFGPDQLYINQEGEKFLSVRGPLVGDVGHDPYKGMNSSVGDVDNNGQLDIYVSNVHEKLQAEGSLLWMNAGTVNQASAKAFKDEAMKRNALNENRFGWGGAMGDLDRDGRLDILQANGMVDNSYDQHLSATHNQRLKGKITTPHYFKRNSIEEGCADFWYWNAQIALTGPDIHGYADRWADLRDRCIFPYEYNRVYLNQGKRFVDVAQQVGWTQPGNSRGIALADLDNDGDLDALVTHEFAPVSIYRNDAAPKSWLGLQLEGDGKGCNRDAIGTQVKIKTNQDIQLREVQESNGFSAQGDRRLLLGLGSDSADTIPVEIHWCGNKTPQIVQLPTNQYHHILQGSSD